MKKGKISIKDLTEFDRDYLIANNYFSTIDLNGKDRNEGQDTIGRITEDLNVFEDAITAITHEIVRRVAKENLGAVIPTYQINKFVAYPGNEEQVYILALNVMKDFIIGEKYFIIEMDL